MVSLEGIPGMHHEVVAANESRACRLLDDVEQ